MPAGVSIIIRMIYAGIYLVPVVCMIFVAVDLFQIADRLGKLVGTVDALKREVEEVKQKLNQ